ncbi:hypothetical protein FRB94_007796 [Tulasnella sp. JGI-2019a]|nr:hypothetical protein FRB93_006797 [Tulasnella sp. JGI-2019a]KAG8997266.1 hypothetical protein FRB94_007796 [Tulasnella sp. JGI-2019a]KAG9028180.1 hypothetical protein FRB95_006758 [Tulasnella sp. JGI-2019a]
MHDLHIGTGNLMGFCVGMVLYGGYLGLCARLFEGLWERRRSSKVAVWIIVSLFFLTTVNIAMCITDQVGAWIKHHPEGVDAYLSPLTWSPSRQMTNTLLTITSGLVDILVFWRLYVLWDMSRIVVSFPACLIVVDIGLGLSASVVAWSTQDITGGPRFSKYLVAITIYLTVVTALVHILCTSLIIGRLWWIGRNSMTAQSRSLYNVVITAVVQSGALYTGTSVIYSAFLISGYYGIFSFVKYIYIMVIAVAPLLLVAQLHERVVTDHNSSDHNRRLRPGDTFQLNHVRSSTHNRPTRSFASAAGNKARQKILGTVPSTSPASNDTHVRIQVDVDVEKGDFVNSEDSPPSSTKFTSDLPLREE